MEKRRYLLPQLAEIVDMKYSCNGNAILSQSFVPKQKEERFEFKVKEEENNNCDFTIKQGRKVHITSMNCVVD